MQYNSMYSKCGGLEVCWEYEEPADTILSEAISSDRADRYTWFHISATI
jgi:hypothetical protein